MILKTLIVVVVQRCIFFDVENIRTKKVYGDTETTYTHNANSRLSQLLVETEGTTVTKYVYGLGLIYEETANDVKVYHYDYRGSTVALTNLSGAVTDTFTYDTYGKLLTRTGTTNTQFLYNGRDGVMTDENGLVYMRARYYNPTLKRFINADVVAGSITNAITLNRYAYANGNPVSNIDPFGLSAERGSQGETITVTVPYAYSGYTEDDCLYPEGWYTSSDEAAYAFGMKYNGKSIEDDIEIATGIYSKVYYLYDGKYRLISEIARLHENKMKLVNGGTSLHEVLKGIDKVTLYQYGEPIYGDRAYIDGQWYKYVDIKFVNGYGKVAGMVHTHGTFSNGGEEFFSEAAIDDDGELIPGDKGLAYLYRIYGIKYKKENPEKGIEEFVSYLVNPLGQLKKHIPSTNLNDQGNVIDITSQYAYPGYEIPAYND